MERPLLFTPENAQKAHVGTKTQTRRIVKERQPYLYVEEGKVLRMDGYGEYHLHNPYGVVGDRLRVREPHFLYGHWAPHGRTRTGRKKWRFVCERAKGVRFPDNAPDVIATSRTSSGWFRRHARFMPRWACRTVLELTGVRVERLQEISEEDARAEGIEYVPGHAGKYFRRYDTKYPKDSATTEGCRSAVVSFSTLWESINGPGSWDANPWVWVLEFVRVREWPG